VIGRDLLSRSGPAAKVPRGRPEGAFAELFELIRLHGAVHEQDVELAAEQLTHAASKALRQTFEALRKLKDGGALAHLGRAEAITDEVLARIESGHATPAELRHVEKVARVELFRLFDDPIRDDDFRVDLGRELKRKHRLTNRGLDELDVPVDTTLRDRHRRQANALRILLRHLEIDPRSPPTELDLACIERLGRSGDRAAAQALGRIAKVRSEPILIAAVKRAIRSIRKASKMTVVLATMEAKPYCGTGGLSNVMAELPKALAKMGHRVIVLVPRHASVRREALTDTRQTGTVYGPQGAERFGLLRDKKDGVDYYFIESDRRFSADRSGIYGDANGDYQDNAERYDFFGAAIPVAIRTILGGEAPDIVQLNDAHTASAAVYLKADPAFEKTRTIMAVHNLGGAYQGKFAEKHLENLRFDGLGLYHPGGPAEFYGELNFMKLGLWKSDAAITVSRKYMEEILTEETGEGLHGLLRVLHARRRLWGNLNGIDHDVWNPKTDPHLAAPFSLDEPGGKAACKSDLQARFGLAKDDGAALIGVVARLTHQKGIDDIIASIERAMAAGRHAQFVILGEGDPAIAERLRGLVEAYPGKVAFDDAFTTEKEHVIYGGSDFFLMPSRFEPCGLPQMYALRYLTVPIVRAVGGLDESIDDYDPKRQSGNGFKFRGAGDLSACLDRAIAWYETGEAGRRPLLERCASSDFSWETSSAVEQVAFYRTIIDRFAKDERA
jgi:starch synthase